MGTKAQIEANRRNRKRWKGHTPEGLERLREAAHQNQPWLKSTGPRTTEGKANSRNNAWIHGQRSEKAVASRRALTMLMALIRQSGLG